MFDRDKLIADLESPANEGFRDLLYDDATGWPIQKNSIVKGAPTWGIGCNASAFRLSLERARIICGWQLDDIEAELVRALPWVLALDEARARALGNMAFQLGVTRLLEFHDALALLSQKRFEQAADAFMQSLWAQQVPARAKRVTDVIRIGLDNV